MLSEARPTAAVLTQRGAVTEVAESAVPRFLGALSIILPAALLVQTVLNRSEYLQPVIPALVWLGMLAVAGWLVPRACARGLRPAEAAAALAAAVIAVAVTGADHRPLADGVGMNWAVLGVIGLLALVAMSRPIRVWLPAAAVLLGVHALFVVRSLGGSPLGLTRVAAGAYAVLIVPSVFAALRPVLRTHTGMAVRRAGLASRVAAERAAVTGIQQDRRDRLALLQAEALPLLAGIAAGSLDPADREVRERCARNAETLRRALAGPAGPAAGLLAGLAPALDAARGRGIPVQVQVVGDPGRPGLAVSRATAGALDAVLRSLPGRPVTLTILAAGERVELYLIFGPDAAAPDAAGADTAGPDTIGPDAAGLGGVDLGGVDLDGLDLDGLDLAGLGRTVPPEAGWSATIETGDGGPGCLEIGWLREAEPR
jgi:hypothetical protein